MTHQDFYNTNGPVLPLDFANQVMELEIKMDTDEYDLEGVQKLNQFYRIAVEYYVNIDIKRANHFQKKLAALLTNAKTLQLIEPCAKIDNSKNQLTQAVKEEVHKFNMQAEQYIQSMLENTEKKLKKSSTLIKEDLNKQEDVLKTRMLQRVKSRRYI